MESKFGKCEQYLSDELNIKTSISEAYLLKLGFIKLQFKNGVADDFETDTSRRSAIEAHVEQLYTSLLNSPHIMEVTPPKTELLSDEQSDLFFRFWGTENIDFISLDQYLKLRVVLPKKKREDLFKFLRSNMWSPEQFTVYFNGATFAALTPISELPVFTYFGQVVREFLVDTVGKTDSWEHIDGFGPTPIHPEFYILITKEQENQPDQPSTEVDSNGNVFILLPSNLPIEEFVQYFLNTAMPALEEFYNFVIARSNLVDAIEINDEENQHLRELMASYFSQSTSARLFGKISGNIRRTLSEMHMSLLEIASLEMQLTKAKTEALDLIKESEFLSPAIEYFLKQTIPDHEFDRNAQLTAMNFAADEASNNSINQATLIAAFLGALVGGLISFIIQMFTK